MSENKKIKILFIAPLYPTRSPSQRFRFDQYMSFFKENNIWITYSQLINETDDKIFYSKGKLFQKFLLTLKFFFIRLKDVFRASKYDIIFIQREAFFIGTVLFEKLFKMSKAKIIFDFDDSIWLNDVSEGNKNLRWLKKPSKIKTIINIADIVFAGNNYLAVFAKKYNSNVKIVPTTINTNYHILKNRTEKSKICIGWTGTQTTLKHFETAIPALHKIKQMFRDKVYFKIIVDVPYTNSLIEIKTVQWRLNSEIEDLSEFDIGIMPLPDDEWAKGKCGFKGLQYMSLEIPTVMSPVGVNSEIIQDGKNGFLANTEEEWIQKLSLLIESKELRDKLGKSGRNTVIEKYSVISQREKYLEYFNNLLY
ncbi:MAG TPA: glycosyl transferase family 1 [Bacteroidales bacterium]|nr:MAG: hypothetical protein A2W98_08650 [Bacteroidetes bacterium GWF2_33_38]OFY75867.1 MAG: hypothetical protein A2265_00110 [Bacteroidetes bacterium RIFOXYA12_FULL_33_9]OFY92230.1 MAG: hypothetical protein A2236_04915 [Bacteroidetes bacterium RIFOXYA2_FULL_33_7]HBF87392.1 glycosyl transferase family 1 [Bacteroidales bacterium]